MKASIIYHFFANYRQPIINSLLEAEETYTFISDRNNIVTPGLPVATIPEESFFEAPCRIFGKAYIFQYEVIKYACRTSDEVMIFLGDWKFISTWIAAVIARVRGKRVLFWTHGWTSEDTWPMKPLRLVFYSIANGLLLYGNRAKTIGMKYGFSKSSLYVVYNSLDVVKQVELRNQVTDKEVKKVKDELFGNDYPVLCCAARFIPSRKLDLLVAAAKLLKKEGYDFNLLLIGDGDERAALGRDAAELGDRAVFTGACFDAVKMAKYTMLSDLTVCPGALGLTAMQSMIYGVPVLTNNEMSSHGPEVEAVIEGVTGCYFDAGCVDSLIKRIKAFLLTAPCQKAKMRANCIQLIETLYCSTYQAEIFSEAINRVPARHESVKDLFKEQT